MIFGVIIPHAGCYLVRHSADLPHQGFFLVLMGSIPDRALAAIELYRAYPQTRQILIVEENMLGLEYFRKLGYKVHTNSAQMASILSQAGIPDSIIRILPGYARSTLMEAQAVKNYLQNEKTIDSLVIISSAAHTRRAFFIFNDFLNRKNDHKVALFTYPSPYSGYNCHQWYRSKEDLQTTLSEYIKITSFYFFER